jgi:LysM repeat protein
VPLPLISTARRRAAVVVLAALVLVPLVGCGSLFGSGSSASTTLPTLPATTTTAVVVATTLAGPTEYVIERGDTMRRIAGKFNTSVEAILAVNPDITDQNKIQAGQKILIPAASAPSTTAAPAAPVDPAATTAPPASSTG